MQYILRDIQKDHFVQYFGWRSQRFTTTKNSMRLIDIYSGRKNNHDTTLYKLDQINIMDPES